MSELEERLRAAVGRRSEGFEPSADLPDRIDARVRHHRRRRQLTIGVLASAAAVVVTAGLVVLVGGGPSGGEKIEVITGPYRTSTTSTPATTEATDDDEASTDTSTSTTTSTPTTTTTDDPAGSDDIPVIPGLDDLLLTRRGIGPITAGMTVREAQVATGITITPSPDGGGGAGCAEMQVEGPVARAGLLVEPVGADPLDGIVRAVFGSVMEAEDGAMVGQTRAEMISAMGQPTRIDDGSATIWGPGAEILYYESGGFAYGVLVADDLVLGVQSGDPAWVGNPDGCP